MAAGSLGAVRLRWFLIMTTILAATVGLTVVISQQLDAGGDGGDQVVGGRDGTTDPDGTTTTPSTTEPAGSADESMVRGTVTVIHLEGAVLDPRDVATPLTIVSDRGFGNGGDLNAVEVDGTPASIVWDGGRPFVLSAGGALVLDPVVVDIAPEGLRLGLGGATHRFRPGTYQLDTPVAVGTTGVAGARDSVAFAATAQTSFTARGDAALILPPAGPRHLVGPGTVRLEGTLEITDATGTRAATTISTATGPFDITLTPKAGGGWTVVATLTGELTTT